MRANADSGIERYIECLPDKVGAWRKVVNPIITKSPVVFGGTVYIEQYYSNSQSSINTQIILSVLGGQIMKGFDARNLGVEYENDRPFPDGRIANVEENKIVSRIDTTSLLWQVALGTPSEEELFAFASHSIDRECVVKINEEIKAEQLR